MPSSMPWPQALRTSAQKRSATLSNRRLGAPPGGKPCPGPMASTSKTIETRKLNVADRTEAYAQTLDHKAQSSRLVVPPAKARLRQLSVRLTLHLHCWLQAPPSRGMRVTALPDRKRVVSVQPASATCKLSYSSTPLPQVAVRKALEWTFSGGSKGHGAWGEAEKAIKASDSTPSRSRT